MCWWICGPPYVVYILLFTEVMKFQGQFISRRLCQMDNLTSGCVFLILPHFSKPGIPFSLSPILMRIKRLLFYLHTKSYAKHPTFIERKCQFYNGTCIKQIFVGETLSNRGRAARERPTRRALVRFGHGVGQSAFGVGAENELWKCTQPLPQIAEALRPNDDGRL